MSDRDAQSGEAHAFAAAMPHGTEATVWCRCGWSSSGQLEHCLDELEEHIDRVSVIDLVDDERIDLTAPEHDIAAIDVEPTGYVVTCACGWRAVAERRDKVSALWWQHVLTQDALADDQRRS